MAFEVVVRPVVNPNIRPAPAQQIPVESDPTSGTCTIKGQGAEIVKGSVSRTVTSNKNNATERKRRVDVARIYQMDDDTGVINKDNYVDVDVTNKMWLRGSQGDMTRSYKRIQEADNIEIRKRDVMRIPSQGLGY